MMRDEILAMEPGRELDVLVMTTRGYREVYNGEGVYFWRRNADEMPLLVDSWQPSTDISAAMPLLDEMLSAVDAQDRTWVLHRDRDNWAVSEMYHDDLIPIAIGAEAPEAITKAWLIWRESEND